jgi:hypothetical protein
MVSAKIIITLSLAWAVSALAPRATYRACGGLLPEANKCPAGYQCISDPRRKGCGLACDEPGICVPKNFDKCGGFAGFVCPKGKKCYDYPADNCDPENHGADCIGICL